MKRVWLHSTLAEPVCVTCRRCLCRHCLSKSNLPSRGPHSRRLLTRPLARSPAHRNPSRLGNRDLPPQGGFAPIKYKRNLPTKGPGGALIFGTVAAICTFGFWRVGQGNLEKRQVLSPSSLSPDLSQS